MTNLGGRTNIGHIYYPPGPLPKLTAAEVGEIAIPPSAGSWTAIATLTSNVANGPGPAFIMGNGARIFAVGNDNTNPTCYEYSIGGDSFSAVAPPPFIIITYTWRTWNEDAGVFIIGARDGVSVDHVLTYDPGLDSWTDGLTLPPTIYQNQAAVSLDGYTYLIGGGDIPSAPPDHDTVYRYDPFGDSWDTLGPLPELLADVSATAGTDGLIYMAGAHVGGGFPTYDRRLYSYDPVGDDWTDITAGGGTWSPGGPEVLCASNGDLIIGGGGPIVGNDQAYDLYRPSNALYADPVVDDSPQAGRSSGAIVGMTAYFWNMPTDYTGAKITLNA